MQLKSFPDPYKHIEKRMDLSMRKYLHELKKFDLTLDEALTSAVIERASLETEADYDYRVAKVHRHNLRVLNSEHRKRMNALKKDHDAIARGIPRTYRKRIRQITWNHARNRLILCPPIAVFFALAGWYNLAQPGNLVTGVCALAISLALLVLPIIGAFYCGQK